MQWLRVHGTLHTKEGYSCSISSWLKAIPCIHLWCTTIRIVEQGWTQTSTRKGRCVSVYLERGVGVVPRRGRPSRQYDSCFYQFKVIRLYRSFFTKLIMLWLTEFPFPKIHALVLHVFIPTKFSKLSGILLLRGPSRKYVRSERGEEGCPKA